MCRDHAIEGQISEGAATATVPTGDGAMWQGALQVIGELNWWEWEGKQSRLRSDVDLGV